MTKTTTKKRILSALVTLCMATALFAGLALAAPFTAHAASDMVVSIDDDLSVPGNLTMENIDPGYSIYVSATGNIAISGNFSCRTSSGLISVAAGGDISWVSGSFSAPGNPITIGAGGSLAALNTSFAGASLTLTVGVASTLTGCDFTGISGEGAIVVNGDITFENCSFSSRNAVVSNGTVTYNNCTFPPDPEVPPAPVPVQSPDHGTDAYYQRHYNFWLPVYTQLQAGANDATVTVDTGGQSLDHIQHYVFDALAGTNRTLVVHHHDGKTYTIRGMAERDDGTMNGILLGNNQLFYGNLDRFRS